MNRVIINKRHGKQVIYALEITGRASSGQRLTVTLTPDRSPVKNYGFDVTPARLVTGLITERGVCPATEAGLKALFPDAA